MTPERVAQAVAVLEAPCLPPGALERLSLYVDLLQRWNRRISLTSVQGEDEILRRHVVEGVAAAQHVPPAGTLLDFGSGAGVPGIPISICHSSLQVVLAESQAKKAAFLREAQRKLGTNFGVYHRRVEALSEGRRFDVVTMRAVDRMEAMLPVARARVAEGGLLLILGTARRRERVSAATPGIAAWSFTAIPGTQTMEIMSGVAT